MKTVLIFGTFDILHAGHIDLMKQAKALGDKLVVVLGRDKRVEDIKGNPPVHDEEERKEILSHISLVDEVYLGDSKDVYAPIQKIKPDVIALGYDQQLYTEKLEEKIIEFGLSTSIVRLQPHKHETHKSGIIKNKLLQDV